MPMIATTIISSIRVKPFCSVLIWRSLHLGHTFIRPSKKKGTPKGTFIEAKSLLLAAAGAGQIFQGNVGAVGGRSTAPPVEPLGRAGPHRDPRCGIRQRDQRDDRAVHHGG